MRKRKSLYGNYFKSELTNAIRIIEQNTIGDKLDKSLEDQDIGNEALDNVLDKGTNPEDLKVDSIDSQNNEDDITSKLAKEIEIQENKAYSTIKEWIKKIDEATKFVNDPMTPTSIRSQLDKAQDGTLFYKIKEAESRKFTRAGTELASVAQALRSYIGQDIV